MLVGASHIDTNRFSEEANAVHDFCGIFSVRLGIELDKAEALMGLGYAILGQVDVDHWSSLKHELVDDGICATLVNVANVNCRIFILLP